LSDDSYLRLHVIVQEGFAHEAHATNQTFVWLLITVDEAMGVPVISAVKCFAANLQQNDHQHPHLEITKTSKLHLFQS